MKLSDFKNNELVTHHNVFGWGWIAYRDVFPNTKVHVTEFCQRLSNFALNGSEKEVKFYIEGCEHHNCTDYSCEDFEVMAEKLGK